MDDYKVHMISFRSRSDGSCNVIMGYDNALPWHIKVLENYLAELKKRLNTPGSELV